ncbi:hypothetical protein MTO96_018847 [Rhipicephalus appendiculatus]
MVALNNDAIMGETDPIFRAQLSLCRQECSPRSSQIRRRRHPRTALRTQAGWAFGAHPPAPHAGGGRLPARVCREPQENITFRQCFPPHCGHGPSDSWVPQPERPLLAVWASEATRALPVMHHVEVEGAQ